MPGFHSSYPLAEMAHHTSILGDRFLAFLAVPLVAADVLLPLKSERLVIYSVRCDALNLLYFKAGSLK